VSDLFRAVQEALRTYKQRGVDFTHPRGVVVFDKHYPAIQKTLRLREKTLRLRETQNGDISKDFNAGHVIPLESGLIIGGWAAVGKNGTFLEHYLKKPYINTASSDTRDRYGWFLDKGLALNDVNDTNGIYFLPREQQALHESMKEWSLEPTHGWSHNDNTNYRDMSLEEHREHQQNNRSSLITHPSKITVSIFKRPQNAFDSYQYDIATEALTPHNSVDFGEGVE